MRTLEVLRPRYCTPETVLASLDCDDVIAQSPLEDVVEGEEWGWEE